MYGEAANVGKRADQRKVSESAGKENRDSNSSGSRPHSSKASSAAKMTGANKKPASDRRP